MTSNDENSLLTTINSLATELIIKIVRLSSPKPSWDNSVERFKHLRNLALVCRAFRGPAQEELFRHVVLPSVAASRRFVAILKSRAGARFASTPRSLRAGEDGDVRINQDKFAIPLIAKRCSRLESMWLLNIDSLEVEAVTSGTGLIELFISGCKLVTALHGRKLDALQLIRLGITNCVPVGAARLEPLLFPNLKSLDISLGDTADPSEFNRFANYLGKELSALSIGDAGQEHPSRYEIDPNRFKNLLTLDCHLHHNTIRPFLSSLPAHIRHLRAEAARASRPRTIPSNCLWSLKFIELYLENSNYPCLENLEHVRCRNDDVGPTRRLTKQLEDKFKAWRPAVQLSFDHYLVGSYDGSLDAKFNPAFWAFVDDAEAEEANRLEAI
ncbi:hypothetical protein RQP46_005245 [Phenoliferia psychrophenolica]